MTLVVETGAGLYQADSFASIADADNYWGGRGSQGTAWLALTTGAKETALRDGTDYVAAQLARMGDPLNDNQGLPWPWDGTDVLARDRATIVRATVLAADVARLGPLLGGAAQGGRVTEESKSLGPLSKSIKYANLSRASSANGRDLSFIDDLLGRLSGTGGGLLIGTSARA